MEGARKKTIALAIFRLFRMGITIFTLSLSAKYFGISLERDSWILALGCITVIDLAVWGGIIETFRTKFIFIREKEGEVIALRSAFSLFFYTSAITILLSFIVFKFPHFFAGIIAPAYKGSQLLFIISLLKILAPSLMLTQITLLGTSVLNAYDSFYIPEILGTISGILNLLLIVILAPQIGIYSLAWAYYISLVLLVVLLLIEYRRKKITLLKNASFKAKHALTFLLFALPYYLPYFLGQASALIEKSISGFLGPGTVSLLDYSRKFLDIPLSVLFSILSTITLPILSLKYAQRKLKEYIVEFNNIFQMGLLLIIIFIGFMLIGAKEVVSLLYKGLSMGDINQIANLARCYAVAFLGLYLYTMGGFSLLSTNKTKTSAVIVLFNQLGVITINLLLYKSLGTFVFPLSLFVCHFLSAVFMNRFTRVKSKSTLIIFGKYCFFGATFMLLISVFNYLLVHYLPINNALILIVVKTIFMFVLVIPLAAIFHLEEIALLRNKLKF